MLGSSGVVKRVKTLLKNIYENTNSHAQMFGTHLELVAKG
jgi:hypothetical protein